jgi:hypothetical protein
MRPPMSSPDSPPPAGRPRSGTLASIPTGPEDISASWITQILQSAGHDVAIRDVVVEPIGTGQMASSLRVTPTYTDPADAPRSMVVKIASHDPNSRQAGARGAYLKEVRFYQEFADDLPVATPGSLWADVDVDTNDFAIVLEDMAPATQGDQIAGSDVASVFAAAINIAGLHAPHWGDTTLFDKAWLTAPRDQRNAGYAELKTIVAMVTPGFIDRYQDRLNQTQIAHLEWFAETVDSWLLNDGGRFALTHGDHRLDNLLFSAKASADRPVTVVDWQTIAVRNPVADISYLLGTSVESTVRREIEDDVVARYHRALHELGVTGYDLADCLDDYRNQTPHALLLTVRGSMLTEQTDRGDDMFMAMLHRSSQQMTDLGVR